MSNARIERMTREMKADSPWSLLDWLFGAKPQVEQPQPVQVDAAPAAAEAQPESVAFRRAA